MDGIDVSLTRDANDIVNGQIRLDRSLSFSHQIAFVRLHAMQRKAILLRVDRNGADALLRRGAHHPDRDLAAVRDQ